MMVLAGVVVAVPLLALSIAVALTPHTTDFKCFWTGARFVLDGRDPYDDIAWAQAMSGQHVDALGNTRSSFCPGRFGYPLTTAIAFLPFALLPITAAAPLWQLLLLGGTFAGTLFVWRALGGSQERTMHLLLLVFGSQPLWNAATNAQFGGLLLGAIGLVLHLTARGQLIAAGAISGLLLLKPHVALPLVFAAWSLRTARLIAAFATTTLLLVVASLIVRPGWPSAWLQELTGSRMEMATVATSTWTLAAWLPGGRALGVVTTVALSLAAIRLAQRVRLTAVEAVALLACLTLAIVPYTGSHDQLLLVPAWAVILHRAIARNERAMLATLPVIMLVLPWLLYAVRDVTGGAEILNAAMPIIASVLLLATLRRPMPGAYSAATPR